jgi:integrase
MRSGELLGLTWRAVDFDDGLFYAFVDLAGRRSPPSAAGADDRCGDHRGAGADRGAVSGCERAMEV